MTFVFYKHGKKYTVNNATVYNLSELSSETFFITSTRGHLVDEELYIKDEAILEEVRVGIAWTDESVN